MIKIVITGGPSSGKTTLINELARRGYYTVREAALYLMETHNYKLWTDSPDIEKKVEKGIYHLQQKWEAEIPRWAKLVFLDRSLIDAIAYYKLFGLKTPKELDTLIKQANYTTVFFLDMLPKKFWNKMINGQPRKQDYKQGLQLVKLTKQAYEDYGFKLTELPFMEVGKRADALEGKLRKLKFI